MSGAGRKHRAKHLCQSHTEDRYELEDGDIVTRMLSARGNHFQVVDLEGNEKLTRLPAKFHKVIWLKRGDIVIVNNEVDDDKGVTCVVKHRLSAKQTKNLIKAGVIPKSFVDGEGTAQAEAENDDVSSASDVEWAGGDPNASPTFEDEETDSDSDDEWVGGNPNVAPCFNNDGDDTDSDSDD
eukprot:TRINITY_DN37658_c0_g1_i1.p1 TRINITY_DN37658_c0_g1~~TRINITY_DN37658_c0_g1_i1.p1  ORF type:complete len:198 (+),score=36.85 TRINITY_DN37658_c0_g1_i1:49-594(+)